MMAFMTSLPNLLRKTPQGGHTTFLDAEALPNERCISFFVVLRSRRPHDCVTITYATRYMHFFDHHTIALVHRTPSAARLHTLLSLALALNHRLQVFGDERAVGIFAARYCQIDRGERWVLWHACFPCTAQAQMLTRIRTSACDINKHQQYDCTREYSVEFLSSSRPHITYPGAELRTGRPRYSHPSQTRRCHSLLQVGDRSDEPFLTGRMDDRYLVDN